MIKKKIENAWIRDPKQSHLEDWAKLKKTNPEEYEIYKKGVKEYQDKVKANSQEK